MVMPKGKGDQGWAGFVFELWKVLETFQISFGNGQLAPLLERSLCWFSSFHLKMYSTICLAPMVHELTREVLGGTLMLLSIIVRDQEAQGGGARWLPLLILLRSRVMWIFLCWVGCPCGLIIFPGLGWTTFWFPCSGNSTTRI